MGFKDGTVKPVQLRTNSDQSILHISIDGTPAIEMAGFLEDNSGNYSTGTQRVVVYFGSTDADYVFFDDFGFSGSGYYGMEAPTEALTGVARYLGGGAAEGDGTWLGANILIDADFANGGLTGQVVGQYSAMETRTDFEGSIVGVISDSRMAAQIDIETEGVSGQLDMLGAFSGVDGARLAGGFGGTVNGGTMGGQFSASKEIVD